MAPVEMTIGDYLKQKKVDFSIERNVNEKLRSDALTKVIQHIQIMTKERQLYFYQFFERLLASQGNACSIVQERGCDETMAKRIFSGIILVLRSDELW